MDFKKKLFIFLLISFSGAFQPALCLDESFFPAQKLEESEKLLRVKEMVTFAWKTYKDICWGQDFLKPVTRTCQNDWNIALTIFDSLPLLFIVGLKDEFQEAATYALNVDFATRFSSIGFFETNIRILGALLSSYHLTNDEAFRQKSLELGNLLIKAFGQNGFIYGSLRKETGFEPHLGQIDSNLGQLGTCYLEFAILSDISDDPQYLEACSKSMKSLAINNIEHVLPSRITSEMSTDHYWSKIGFGSDSDSYYEYLLKSWILLPHDPFAHSMKENYLHASNTLLKHSLRRTQSENKNIPSYAYLTAFSASIDRQNNTFYDIVNIDQFEHLTCFAAGTLALGHVYLLPETHLVAGHLDVAQDIAHLCYSMYEESVTGIAPNVVSFRKNGEIFPIDATSFLRPEAVESFFYLWRITKKQKYRDWAWNIFLAIENNAKTESGYSGLRDVNSFGSFDDYLDSFVYAETFLYLYLIFSDNSVLSLHEWVFNTEGHPLKRSISASLQSQQKYQQIFNLTNVF